MRTRAFLLFSPFLATFLSACDSGADNTQVQIQPPPKPAGTEEQPKKKIQAKFGPGGIAPGP